METINSISDLIEAVKKNSPPPEENSSLFDLYRTIKKGITENGSYYQGQGSFRDTLLCFFDNELITSVAPPVEDLNLEEMDKRSGEPILEIKAEFTYKYPSTGKEVSYTARAYLRIREGEVYLGEAEKEKLGERKAREVLRELSSVNLAHSERLVS